MKLRILLLLPALAACSSTIPLPQAAQAPGAVSAAQHAPPAAPFDVSQLGRYPWRLDQAVGSDGRRIDALFARADRPVQLDFSDGRLSVGNTCNRMGSDYEIVDGRLKLGPLVRTKMACADPALTALDNAISTRLAGDPALELQGEGESSRLILRIANGDRLVFVGVPAALQRKR